MADLKLRDLSLSLSSGPRFFICGQKRLSIVGTLSPSAVPYPLSSCLVETDAVEKLRQHANAINSGDEVQGLVELCNYAWNGVFTSRVDTGFTKLFEESWRRIVVTSMPQLGRSPRSSSELQIRMLFGGVDLPPEELPPRDTITLSEVKVRARATLDALATKYITPRGAVIIDYIDDDDWLSREELFNFVSQLQPGQAYLFSASRALRTDPYIETLISRRLLTISSAPAIDALEELANSGALNFEGSSTRTATSRIIPLGGRFIDMPIDVWNQIAGSVRPIDTELLAPAPIGSPAIEYQRFRDTLGSSEGIPPWKSTASGWKIQRDFERSLSERVKAGISDRNHRPIIISGQTATGKSMACCQLALDVARVGTTPVIHHSRRGQRPLFDSIDKFSGWAEENGAPTSLLIWDGMLDPREYYELNRILRSRGRRVQIVGTSYKRQQHDRDAIDAPAFLSKSEIDAIRELLSRFEIDVDRALRLTLNRDGDVGASFLALLYRALPESEAALRRGLSLEMRAVEADFEKAASRKNWNPHNNIGSLAAAFADAGYTINLASPSERPDEELIQVAFEDRSTAERITALVLTAGRRGLQIPLELILRIIGRSGVQQIVDLVTEYDIFRWTEDDESNQYIGSRTTLEAELLARGEISIDQEIDILSEFILEAVVDPDKNAGGREVQFIVGLLEQLGPQGQGRAPYIRHYNRLAEAFAERRIAGAPAHPRFALVEANFRREYTKWASGRPEESGEDGIANLLVAQQVLSEALSADDVVGRTRANLLVELASAIGSQLHALTATSTGVPHTTLTALLDRAVDCSLEARAISPESVYPVDVVAWTSMRVVQRADFDWKDALDILATADASLNSLPVETLSPPDRAQYNLRRAQLAQVTNNSVAVEQHLSELRQNDDPAAYYFLARYESQTNEGVETAFERLLRAPVEVRSDWRCARMLFDLFWLVKTGERFMSKERVALGFDRTDWTECIEMLDLMESTDRFDSYRADYARGIALFHLDRFKESQSVFQRLDSESLDLSRRVVSSYVASDPEGRARVFTGRVIKASDDGKRGSLWVDQLATEVRFIPQRFSVTEFRHNGDIVPSFNIAFNMRGALADPIRSGRR